MRWTVRWLQSCLLLLAFAGTSTAQTQSAQVSGIVRDSSGAIVIEADVTVTNVDTGIKRTTTSNDAGVYSVPLLSPGSYNIFVRRSGFRPVSRSGIRLYVNDRAQIDFVLEVGAVSEAVTVTAAVPLVETQSGTVRGVVDQQRITDLPLNGRDVTQLVAIQAGIIPQGGDDKEGLMFAANGSRRNGVGYLLDGGYNTHTYRGYSGLFPNPDAVQEFSIQRNNFTAEHANATGAVVSVITRSGTNQFHGSAFEFLRNGAFNARNFFAPRRDALKRNQYGATLGGPVIRDKVFFFGSYQNTRIRSSPGETRQFLPTAAQRAGDFSSSTRAVVDPRTGTAFPGNRIPASRLNPVSLAFLKYLPDPGTPDGQRFTGILENPDEPEYLGRLDVNLGAHTISGRTFIRRYKKPFGQDMNDYASMYASAAAAQIQNQDHHTFNHTWVISPRLVNNVIFSYRKRDTAQDWVTNQIPFTYQDAGVKGLTPTTPPGVLIEVSGDFLARPGRHAALNHRDLHWSETATYSAGRHEIRFGGEVIRSTQATNNIFNSYGEFQFNGAATGVAMADFMLGEVRRFRQSAGEYKDLRGTRAGVFFQDNFKATQNLTLNLGLRWDPWLPYTEVAGRVQCYRPGMQSTRFVNSPTGYLHAGDAGCPEGGINKYWGAFAPRFGYAWRPFGSQWVVRGGAGLFWDPQFTALYNSFVTAAPHSPLVERFGVRFDDPYAGAANPFQGQTFPYTPPADAAILRPLGAIGSFTRDFRPSSTTSYNLTVERPISTGTVARVSYIGTLGRHLSYADDLNYARYVAGASTTANLQQRRPQTVFNSIRVVSSDSTSSYHALQASVERRVSRGFSVEINYTWSKSIDEASADAVPGSDMAAVPGNRRANRALSDFDIPHRLVSSYVWVLPRMAATNGLVRNVLGGWQTTGIVTLQAGTPFSVFSGFDNSFSGINADYADLVGNPYLDSGRSRGDRIARYFNVDAFAPNALGTFGTSPRNVLRGPGYANFDMGLMKEFRAKERVTFQLRGEAFNALNRPNFNNPERNRRVARFGQLLNASDPRIIQVALKVRF